MAIFFLGEIPFDKIMAVTKYTQSTIIIVVTKRENFSGLNKHNNIKN